MCAISSNESNWNLLKKTLNSKMLGFRFIYLVIYLVWPHQERMSNEQ